jgi:agmatine deiminase
MARAMSDKKPFLPPEWAPQAALWCGWPHLATNGAAVLKARATQIAGFIRAAAGHLPVRVAAGSAEALASATAAVGDVAKVVELPAGDIWLRDTGPIVTVQGQTRAAQTFRFNGWGGKYLMPGDTETAGAIAAEESLPATSHDIVLEGGAIDADGTGRLLTTRQCLLNPNRNPDLTADEIEALHLRRTRHRRNDLAGRWPAERPH